MCFNSAALTFITTAIITTAEDAKLLMSQEERREDEREEERKINERSEEERRVTAPTHSSITAILLVRRPNNISVSICVILPDIRSVRLCDRCLMNRGNMI